MLLLLRTVKHPQGVSAVVSRHATIMAVMNRFLCFKSINFSVFLLKRTLGVSLTTQIS
jgi:hypothetical protein